MEFPKVSFTFEEQHNSVTMTPSIDAQRFPSNPTSCCVAHRLLPERQVRLDVMMRS